jgi:hypothetical protein
MTVVWVVAGAVLLVGLLVPWMSRRVLPAPEDDGHPVWTADLHHDRVTPARRP